MIGRLYRHTNTALTFMIASIHNRVCIHQGIDDCWYEVLQEGVIKSIRKEDFDLALELGKIELVK